MEKYYDLKCLLENTKDEKLKIFIYRNSYNELGLSTLCVKKDKEIERLNNIINELEKWCIDYRENTGLDNYEAGLFNALGDVLDKIKELKGVDKE